MVSLYWKIQTNVCILETSVIIYFQNIGSNSAHKENADK